MPAQQQIQRATVTPGDNENPDSPNYFRAYSQGMVSTRFRALEEAIRWCHPKFGGVIVEYDAHGRRVTPVIR